MAVNIQMPNPTSKQQLGALVTEGKTKKVYRIKGSDLVSVVAKDDITAGDGAKHDIIPDKGRLANRTTSQRVPPAQGVRPSGRLRRTGQCDVIRRADLQHAALRSRGAARGARFVAEAQPQLAKGQLFSKLLVEFFLKTKDKNWKGKPLVADDPLMSYENGSRRSGCSIRRSRSTARSRSSCCAEPTCSATRTNEVLPGDGEARAAAFLVLEKAWSLEGGTLVDFKVEFGIDAKGNLLLADVIDNDSWRVLESGAYIDKQVYRDGGALDTSRQNTRGLPTSPAVSACRKQRIILWRGSESDKPEAFTKALGEYADLMKS